MPRAGLGPGLVAGEALRMVDEAGIGALSLAALAARLGVQRPSLYNHVSSIDGLREAMRAIVYDELAATVDEVARGAGRKAFFAVMRALREYVVRHPRRTDLLLDQVEDASGRHREAAQRLLGRVIELLGKYGLTGVRAVHAARMFRALWIGFALLESRGGYAMDVPVERSFTFALETVHRAMMRPRSARRPVTATTNPS